MVDNASPNNSAHMILKWLQCPFRSSQNPDFVTSPVTITASTPQNVTTCFNASANKDAKFWLLKSEENKGYAGGNNLGMTLALALGADAVWILNNDTVVDPAALSAMRNRLFASARPGLCGSLILYAENPNYIQCRGGGHTNRFNGLSYLNGYRQLYLLEGQVTSAEVEPHLNFIYGASVMASKAFIQQVGMMDEKYFMYCEEQDWAFRAKGRFDLVYAPQAIVYHFEGISSGWPRTLSITALLQITRSRILLTAKHTPYALPIVGGTLIFAFSRLIMRRVTAWFKKLCVRP